MHLVIILILSAVVLGILGYLGVLSVQSILQGRVLRAALPLGALKDNLDKPVAVHGAPEVAGGHAGPYGFPVLWYRQEVQHYRRSGKSGHWSTVSKTERGYDFNLNFPDGGRVVVRCKPTESHGGGKRIEKEGWLSHTRVVHTWFPQGPAVTVLGKLCLTGEGATLVPDEKLGMLFSTRTPEGAAAAEYAKGAAGLVFIASVLVLGLGLLLSL